ncbi:glycosyltransferase family 39 protein, partial [Verrucomicrobiota bacterium]
MSPAERNRRLLILCALAAITFLVYAGALRNEFILYDDPDYVTENPIVRQGLTRQGTVWAFTTFHAGNWHPLTWLSHMLDCELFGLKPWGHHLVSLLLHVGTTMLLFHVLWRMTGAVWRSAFVAAMFAWHPLHVESVAWASERKDVLSGLFWVLTLLAYARYVEKPCILRYGSALILFALGLTAKGMLVTLPFVLLLLDVWPLRRLAAHPSRAAALPSSRTPVPSARIGRLLLEKVPFLALTAAVSVVNYQCKQQYQWVISTELLPLHARIANALVGYVRYASKTVWPADLAVFYPLRGSSPVPAIVMAGLALAAVSLAVVALARRHPSLVVGWLWFLGTLVPVIGLVQAGDQAIADRYSYIPMIGL